MRKSILITIAMFLGIAAYAQTATTKTFIHFKSGEVKEFLSSEIDSITFAGEPASEYDIDMVATHMTNVYLGKGQYCVNMSTQPMTDEGFPTEIGQRVVRFYALNAEPEDPDVDITLPAGTYVSSASLDDWTIYCDPSYGTGYLCVITCTGMTEDGATGFLDELEYGQVEVSYEGTNCKIVFTGGYNVKPDEEIDFMTVRATYEGAKIEFRNEDIPLYKPLDHDVTLTPNVFYGAYYDETDCGDWSLAFYNTELDEDGYIIKAGDMVNFELMCEPSKTMDFSLLPGEYVLADVYGLWAPGQCLSGAVFDMYGSPMPMGTYYDTFNEYGGTNGMFGLASSGTVKVTMVDETSFRVVADLTTDEGYKITMDAIGTTDMIESWAGTYTAPAVKAKREIANFRTVGGFKSCKKAVNIKDAVRKKGSAIRLIKKK